MYMHVRVVLCCSAKGQASTCGCRAIHKSIREHKCEKSFRSQWPGIQLNVGLITDTPHPNTSTKHKHTLTLAKQPDIHMELGHAYEAILNTHESHGNRSLIKHFMQPLCNCKSSLSVFLSGCLCIIFSHKSHKTLAHTQ